MVKYIKYTPELSNNWSRAWTETQKQRPWQFKRLTSSSTTSQLQGKLWLINELQKLDLKFTKVCLVGGWFAQLITPLLFDNFKVDIIHNYDIDEDAQLISYKFNRRYKEVGKYKAIRTNTLIHPLKEEYDLVINTSCEHMYPMKKFRELNPELKSWFVLQSTNETKFDDHINCVNSTKELAEQGELKQILYEGQLTLDNGMTRFMVIGI
tara:strand:+ start:116 stop:742 length:627 start_codon:yes stop_codon:yes gene_type:complete